MPTLAPQILHHLLWDYLRVCIRTMLICYGEVHVNFKEYSLLTRESHTCNIPNPADIYVSFIFFNLFIQELHTVSLENGKSTIKNKQFKSINFFFVCWKDWLAS